MKCKKETEEKEEERKYMSWISSHETEVTLTKITKARVKLRLSSTSGLVKCHDSSKIILARAAHMQMLRNREKEACRDPYCNNGTSGRKQKVEGAFRAIDACRILFFGHVRD